jgi:hypothetical protein
VAGGVNLTYRCRKFGSSRFHGGNRNQGLRTACRRTLKGCA